MHDDYDLRQEQLNKVSLLSSRKFLETLLEMFNEHVVSMVHCNMTVIDEPMLNIKMFGSACDNLTVIHEPTLNVKMFGSTCDNLTVIHEPTLDNRKIFLLIKKVWSVFCEANLKVDKAYQTRRSGRNSHLWQK